MEKFNNEFAQKLTNIYDLRIKKIKKFCHGKEFKLIEYLSAELLKLIKKDCGKIQSARA